MDAEEIVPISRGKLRRFMYENYAEGVAATEKAIIAKMRYHICFDHLETEHCDHMSCWELIRIIKDLDPEQRFDGKPIAIVGQALEFYADPNLVWSDDLERIKQPLIDLLIAVASSGTAYKQVRLLAQAMLPEIDE